MYRNRFLIDHSRRGNLSFFPDSSSSAGIAPFKSSFELEICEFFVPGSVLYAFLGFFLGSC